MAENRRYKYLIVRLIPFVTNHLNQDTENFFGHINRNDKPNYKSPCDSRYRIVRQISNPLPTRIKMRIDSPKKDIAIVIDITPLRRNKPCN
ncbi:MAG: hypothetical protein AB7O87_05825 [Candidatus Nitrosocosmicus sp.]